MTDIQYLSRYQGPQAQQLHLLRGEEMGGRGEDDDEVGGVDGGMMLGMDELDGYVLGLDLALGVLYLEWRCSEPSVIVLVTLSISFFPLTQLFRLSEVSTMSVVMWCDWSWDQIPRHIGSRCDCRREEM